MHYYAIRGFSFGRYTVKLGVLWPQNAGFGVELGAKYPRAGKSEIFRIPYQRHWACRHILQNTFSARELT
jgi:hypothetical protein